MQVIDVDDLAEFAVAAASAGTVNAVGDDRPLVEVLRLFRSAAGHGGETLTAEEGWLVDRGVRHWAGERSLPLWLPPEMPGFTTRSNARYRAAGGRLRPLEETVARVVADEAGRGADRERRAGLTRADELALLAELL